jgi:hypothetical protein
MSGLEDTEKDSETQNPGDSEAQVTESTGSMPKPEGGLQGWMTVTGSYVDINVLDHCFQSPHLLSFFRWLILFSTLGFVVVPQFREHI